MPPASGIKHELGILAVVLGTAVVFGVVVAFLPGLGRTTVEEDKGATQYKRALAMEKEDPAKAMEMFAAIGPDTGAWHDRARNQLNRLKAEAARRPPKPSDAEQKDYDALLEHWRSHAGEYDELIRKGEEFVMAHPRGELRPDVEERIAHARLGRVKKREQDAEETEAAVRRALEKKDFAAAILAIERVSERLRTELDVWARLAARRDSIVGEARKHYLRQVEESNRMVKEGLKDDARRMWYGTLRAFGDGKVPELNDLHRAALLRSEEIR